MFRLIPSTLFLALFLVTVGSAGCSGKTKTTHRHPEHDSGTPDGSTHDAGADSAVPGMIGDTIQGEAADDRSGTSVAFSNDGSRLIIGTNFNDGSATNAGQARVWERINGQFWAPLGQDLDGEAADDRYGSAVAISHDGNRIAIGAPRNDGNGGGSGHVRVFDLSDNTWVQVGADIDGPVAGAQAGWTLALSADGSRLVIGAPSANDTNGRVLVYESSGNDWVQIGQTLLSDHENGDAVDISDDGSRIAVGAPAAQSSDGYEGRVTVYSLETDVWTPVGGVLLGAANNEYFGTAVSLSADGSFLAVGASASDIGGTNAGAVRVYEFDGDNYVQIGGDLTGDVNINLGTSVSLSADGARLIAGGPGGPNATSQLYFLVGGTWMKQTNLQFTVGDQSGTSVAIAPDGHTIAVGTPLSDYPDVGNNNGEVRVFYLD